MKSRFLVLCIALCGFTFNSIAQVDVDITLVEFASGFTNPVEVVHAGDERLFVVEQNGNIRIIQPDGSVNSTPFLNMSSLTSGSGERGLLGLAFHPDYTVNGYFYVNYTMSSSGATRISRFTVSANPDVAYAASRVDLLTISQPYTNHNGGSLKFGHDGYLYIGMGDGGSGEDPLNSGQDMSSLLGKILRIDVNQGALYGIPTDNPFIGASSDTLPEIWASGIRNPWRMSFDRETGDLWIGDVGQYSWEEIDFQAFDSPGGENYGWRCYEGNHAGFGGGCPPMSEFVAPVTEYSHAGGACSVTGGYVYRGSDYPTLYGKYFFCDYCNGKFYSLERNDADEWVRFEVTGNTSGGWSGFGEDMNGELYVVNQGDDKVYRIIDANAPPACQVPSNLDVVEIGFGTSNPRVNATWTNPEGTLFCEVRGGRISSSSYAAGEPEFANPANTKVINQTNGSTVNFNVTLYNNPNIPFIVGQRFGYDVRCMCSDGSGLSEWANITPESTFVVPAPPVGKEVATSKLLEAGMYAMTVFPNPAEGMVNIQIELAEEGSVELILQNALGQTVAQERVSGVTMNQRMDVSTLEAGIYMLVIRTAFGVIAERVIVK